MTDGEWTTHIEDQSRRESSTTVMCDRDDETCEDERMERMEEWRRRPRSNLRYFSSVSKYIGELLTPLSIRRE